MEYLSRYLRLRFSNLSIPREYFYSLFGLLRFRSPLLAESFLLSFPPGTKMFQFPGFPSYNYFFSLYDNVYLYTLSSLIRISTDLRIFAPPRSFSQLVTSFFGAMYLGILRMLFVAWSFLSIALSLSFYLLVSTKILHSNSTNLLYTAKKLAKLHFFSSY